MVWFGKVLVEVGKGILEFICHGSLGKGSVERREVIDGFSSVGQAFSLAWQRLNLSSYVKRLSVNK